MFVAVNCCYRSYLDRFLTFSGATPTSWDFLDLIHDQKRLVGTVLLGLDSSGADNIFDTYSLCATDSCFFICFLSSLNFFQSLGLLVLRALLYSLCFFLVKRLIEVVNQGTFHRPLIFFWGM